MLRTLSLSLALGLLSGTALAQGSQTVVLKEHLVTTDAVITLSDLFDQTGEAGDVALARAPAPGRALSLSPEFVQQSAAREGLYWANAGGMLRVTIERAARTVEARELVQIVEEALFVETGRPHDITLSNTRQTLHAPIDMLGAPELISFDHDPRSAMFRAEIAPYPGGEAITVSGRARRVTDVPVLSRTLSRGDMISESDIRWVRLPENQVRGEILLNAEDLIGMTAQRALTAERPIRSYDIAPPIVVERGELVSLMYEVGALTLTVQARALENAEAGAFIRFVNLQSNRTVEAQVTGPGLAHVYGGHNVARPSES